MKKYLLIFLILFLSAKTAYAQSWKNFYGIAWRDTATNSVRYAHAMGYDYVAVKSDDYSDGTVSAYINNPNLGGLDFYISDYRYLKTTWSGNVTLLYNDAGTNPSHAVSVGSQTWYMARAVMGTQSNTFPENMVSGGSWGSNSTRMRVTACFQQQSVITEFITNIMINIATWQHSAIGFDFAGLIDDTYRLAGSFWDDQTLLLLSHWNGTDSCSWGGTHTHTYGSYTTGLSEFYKQLQGSITASYPNAKWIIEPYRIYSTTANTDEAVYNLSQRGDWSQMLPSYFSQEKSGLEFSTDNNNFNTIIPVTRNIVGSSQNMAFGESDNRLIGIACATGTSYYNWFGRYGGSGDMPDYQAVADVPVRLKLIRCIPNWDNLILVDAQGDLLSTSTTRVADTENGTASYHSIDTNKNNRMNSHINNHAYWGRYCKNPDTKVYAAIGTNSSAATFTLPSGQIFLSANYMNDYCEPAGTATSDFMFNSATGILSLAPGVTVDSSGWTGYIITLGTTSTSIGGSGQTTMTGGGSITIQ